MMYKEQDIITWAEKRNIFEKGDALTQGLKCLEEVAEVINDYLKGKDVSMELGDVYVTLVLQAKMQYSSLEECITINTPQRDTFKEQVADLVLDVAMMLESIQTNSRDKVLVFLGSSVGGIRLLADMENVNLLNCIDLAYDKINKRQGKMVDGVFINESPN